MKFFNILFLCFLSVCTFGQTNTAVISGRVQDFSGKDIDGAIVEIKHPDFSTAYETRTDRNGLYRLEVEKGKYMAMVTIRREDYPFGEGAEKPAKEQRLGHWVWNLVVDKDITINPRYDRVEIYGLNAFRVIGAAPGYTIYCRPMSLSKFQAFPKDKRVDADMSVDAANLDVKVYIDGEQVKVNKIQQVEEYVPEGHIHGFLLHTDPPKKKADKSYQIIRLEANDKKSGDKGEALYFKEIDYYN